MKKSLLLAITTLMATTGYAQSWERLTAENQTMEKQLSRQITATQLVPTARLNEGKLLHLVKKSGDGEQVISEQPEGTLYDNTYNSSGAYFETGFGQAMFTEMDGVLGAYVKDESGNVYIKNPFSKLRTDTWAKGTMRGDTLYIRTPQLIAINNDNGNEAKYYLYNMTLNENQTNFIVDSVNTEIKFVFQGDTLRQVSEGLVGLTTARGGWTGYGDFGIVMIPQTDIATVKPEGLNTEQYVLSYANTYGTRSGVLCEAGILNDTFYLGSLCEEMGDKWISGKINGNKLSIDLPQYLGPDVKHGYHLYAFSGTSTFTMDKETQQVSEYISMTRHLEFDINPENGTLSTDSILILNLGRNNFYYLYGYRQPILKKHELRAGTPDRALFTDYMAYTAMDGYGGVKFVLPEFTLEGDFLDVNSLYYNIYFDDELYTFNPSLYTKLSEPMTDVPVTFTDKYDFVTKGNVRTVYYYRNDFRKIGVQMVYKYGGEVHKSDITYLDTQVVDDIQETTSASRVKSTSYFDLSGRKISAPSRGIVLKSITMEDGTVKTVKMVNP
ncbi:MAG: hypothetical protein SPI30_05625 [Prevotella sp.]|nr:hypothetical protein [Prevotella sp.]